MICSTFCTFICDIYVMSFISLYFALISASTGRKIKSEKCTRTNHVYKGSASKCRNRFPCAAFSQWNRNRQPNLAAAKSVETFVVPRFCSARDALASCALCRPISIPLLVSPPSPSPRTSLLHWHALLLCPVHDDCDCDCDSLWSPHPRPRTLFAYQHGQSLAQRALIAWDNQVDCVCHTAVSCCPRTINPLSLSDFLSLSPSRNMISSRPY